MDTRTLVLDTIRTLAQSRGSYGRLLEDISLADQDTLGEWLGQFSECSTPTDVITRLEG